MLNCCVLSVVIVVCLCVACLPSPPQDPRRRWHHTPQPSPPSFYPLCSCYLVYLIVACIRDRFDGRSFSSVDASQMFNWVIIVDVTIVAVVTVVRAMVSTLPATAVASTATSVVVVFAPAPLPATAVLRVALALTRSFSFSIGVARSSPRWRRHQPTLEDSRPQ